MKIIIANGIATVESPYNPNFVTALRKLGGKWNGTAWLVDARNVELVREKMRKVYGMDDVTTPNLVSVRIRVNGTISVRTSPVILFGRVVASASGRDSGARIGDGVVFEHLEPTSGGSTKYWETVIPSGSIFIIHDVPEGAMKLGCHNYDIESDIIGVNNVDYDGLVEERTRLIARLSEIDRMLAERHAQ